MKTLKTFALVFSLLIAGHARAEDKTEILNTQAQKKVVLADPVKDALKKWNPNWVLYSVDDYAAAVVELFAGEEGHLPMATFGDFDGDGIREDLALYGHDEKSELAVFVIKKKSEYQVLKMAEADYTNPQELNVSAPSGSQVGLGTYLELVKNKDLKYKKKKSKTQEAIQVEEYRGPAQQYFILDGKVIENKAGI